jgi:hypothetical protein
VEGQTLETALAGRERHSIRTLGGAVEARRYGEELNDGRWSEHVLLNLEYADLRQSGLREIGKGLFYHLYRLRRVEFPAELERISVDAFRCDSALTEIWLPERLRTVSDHAFADCSGLGDVVSFPPSFETLGTYAFSNCTSLRSVELPLAMKRIEPYAFDGCCELERLVVGDVEEWRVDSAEQQSALGFKVYLKELRLIGRRWEKVPAGLSSCLAPNARVIGPSFVGRKLGRFAVVSK